MSTTACFRDKLGRLFISSHKCYYGIHHRQSLAQNFNRLKFTVCDSSSYSRKSLSSFSQNFVPIPSSNIKGKLQTSRANTEANEGFISRNIWTLSTLNPELDLAHYEKTVALLDAISGDVQSRDEFQNEISQYLQTLHNLAYENLSDFPWIHSHNPSISYMQLLMNDKLETAMNDIQQHENFRLLLRWLVENCHTLNTDDLARCLVITLWLGVDKTDYALQEMFLQAHDSVSSMSLCALVDLTDALRALPRTDVLLVTKITQHFLQLFEDFEKGPSSELDFLFLCRLGTNLWNFLSDATARRISQKLSEKLNSFHEVENVAVLSSYCRFTKRIRGRQILKDELAVDKVAELLLKCEDRLNPPHIAEIAHSMKSTGLYVEMADVLQRRSLELLQSGKLNKIGEITNTCYAFNRNISASDRHRIEDNIFRHIGDADVLVLSNLADILVDIDCRNQDIIRKFAVMVVKQKSHLLNFVTRLSKVLRFLNLKQCARVSQSEELYEAIFQQLYQQQGLHVWSISNLANFLLRHVNHVIPSLLQERLMAAIPQCDISELYPIMMGLSKIRRPRVRMMQSQVQDLQAQVHRSIMKHVEKISSLDMLHQMIVTLIMRWEAKDLVLLDALMDQYPKFTKQMKETGFVKTVNLMSQLVYHSPRILEDLSKHTINNYKELGIERFYSFIRMLSLIGYQPYEADALSQISAELFDESKDLLDIPNQLNFCLYLCTLQMYPESILNTVFSVEYIEDVDKFINDFPDYRGYVEKTFMKLNRAVVLECPNLDVPWFHEQYCVDNPQTKPLESNQKLRKFVSELDNCLEEILGGRRFYNSNCVSLHYHHSIDFECLLNPDGVVMPYSASSIENSQELGFQRVAVLALNQSDYCRNNRRLNGYKHMTKRHLEIMGYKVVQVPVFDWSSMALTEYPAKLHYLRDKIFKS